MNSKSGFTLIELLVSAALIAIISSIAMAQYSESKSKGNDSLTVSQVISLKTAVEAVISELPAFTVCSASLSPDSTEVSSRPDCRFDNFAGFFHQPGVALILSIATSGTEFYNIEGAHCAGSPASSTSGQGIAEGFHKSYTVDNLGNMVISGDAYRGMETGPCPAAH